MTDETNTARELALAIRNVRNGPPKAEGTAYTLLSVWASMADKAAEELDAARGDGASIPLIGGGAIDVRRREPGS